jgi:DNA modification methylase
MQGDCVEVLKTLPDQSVQMCVTSPPYYGLRDYGVDGQIGLEETPEAYVEKMVAVFREVKRVLKDYGTAWINLGDSYANASNERLKQKDLIGIPWMIAFALRNDGWYLRSDIIWHKPNPMPESVKDRPTKAHEYIFLMSKNGSYYYDHEAIKQPTKGNEHDKHARVARKRFPTDKVSGIRNPGYYPMANKRTVWRVNPKPFKEAHFAVFPENLIKPCIFAGSAKGDTVLDPFNGSGTTGVVCMKYERDYIGIELNPEYIEMSRKRIENARAQMHLPLA